MPEFKKDNIEIFLGVVRKYMQVRGPLSQKDLAELTDVGVSTMSRFLTMKTSELNPQLIAKIVAKLNIPLHEVIDFVEEEYADKFIRLVKFYKNESDEIPLGNKGMGDESSGRVSFFSDDVNTPVGRELVNNDPTGTAKREVVAKIKLGEKTETIHFNEKSNITLSEKLGRLSPRQKAYINDFLNLDMEGRDLVVDIGNDLFRYFKNKGFDF